MSYQRPEKNPSAEPDLLSGLNTLPESRRASVEKQIRNLIEGKEPEHMPEIGALQERMVAEEAGGADKEMNAEPA